MEEEIVTESKSCTCPKNCTGKMCCCDCHIFPSLITKATETNSAEFDATAGWGYTEETIKEYCLDKKRVKDSIEKHINYCCYCGCTYGKDRLLKELGL